MSAPTIRLARQQRADAYWVAASVGLMFALLILFALAVMAVAWDGI